MQQPFDDLVGLLGSTITRKALLFSTFMSSLALFASYFSTLNISDVNGNLLNFALIPTEYHSAIVAWALSNLAAWVRFGFKRQFITSNVKCVECHFCGSDMVTTRLTCLKCHSESKGTA